MVAALTPYYDDGQCVIYHGDCREVDAWLAGDVLVTDPPYGIAYETGMDHRSGTNRSRKRSVAGDDTTEVRDEALAMWGKLPALVFGSWKRQRPIGTRALLTWEKGLNCGMGDLSIPWKANTEEVYVMGSGFQGHRGSSVLRFQAPPSQESWGRLHPTEKPLDLMRALLLKCPAEWVVSDPFMGSGTTARACADLGRKFIGVEIEERYCEVAAKRLAQMSLTL